MKGNKSYRGKENIIFSFDLLKCHSGESQKGEAFAESNPLAAYKFRYSSVIPKLIKTHSVCHKTETA